MGNQGYIYAIKRDIDFKTKVLNVEFENDWMKLVNDGTITIKGSNFNGYAWDGCSPKWKFMDVAIGTPEGVLNAQSMISKTYYPSLVHDIFYQFSFHIKDKVKRKDVDLHFYDMLLANNFRLSKVYYGAVRSFGGFSWGKKHD